MTYLLIHNITVLQYYNLERRKETKVPQRLHNELCQLKSCQLLHSST